MQTDAFCSKSRNVLVPYDDKMKRLLVLTYVQRLVFEAWGEKHKQGLFV